MMLHWHPLELLGSHMIVDEDEDVSIMRRNVDEMDEDDGTHYGRKLDTREWVKFEDGMNGVDGDQDDVEEDVNDVDDEFQLVDQNLR